MNYLKDFNVPFSSLSEGIHRFDYTVDEKFFKEFEFSEFTEGKVNVVLMLDKKINMMVLDFEIEGVISCLCDRCNDPYDQVISGTERLIVKFSDEPENREAEEVVIIPTKANEFNISQDLYEFVSLLIPIRKVHPQDKNGKDTCNPETLKILDKLKIKETVDPRWEELKNISFKN